MIEKNPGESKNVEELLKKAKMLRTRRNYKKAIEICDSILKEEKDNAKALNSKGIAIYMCRDYEKALEIFEKATAVDPNFDKALYNKGLALFKLDRHEDAVEAFEKAIKVNQDYARSFNGKGASLFELGRYEEAIETFKEAKSRSNDARPWVNAAEVYLLHSDLDSARDELTEAFKRDDKNTNGLIINGRIEIEVKDYDSAIEEFRKAARSDLDDPTPLLWIAYAMYLKAECSIDIDLEDNGKKEKDKKEKEEILSYRRERNYKNEIFSIIRELERADELCKKKSQEKLKACILYFLGYFYYKSKDTFAAKEKLEECINLKSKSPIEQRAHELLDSIWCYTIKPPWWRWWLWSPVNRTLRRIIFLVLLIPIFLLLFHPTIPEWVSFIKADWTVSLIVVALSIFIILSPSISSIKAKEVEVELRSPPSFEPFVVPLTLKEKIEQHVELECNK
jgi:Tfp pilus assembly protein PilF